MVAQPDTTDDNVQALLRRQMQEVGKSRLEGENFVYGEEVGERAGTLCMGENFVYGDNLRGMRGSWLMQNDTFHVYTVLRDSFLR